MTGALAPTLCHHVKNEVAQPGMAVNYTGRVRHPELIE
jgi:hypothetical protein